MGKEEKINELADNIPGISKGFKGLSVEAGREMSAARLRAEMPEGGVELLVIHKKAEHFLNLPHLGSSKLKKPKSWIPRYDSVSGDVYTTRWGGIDTIIGEKDQSIDKSGEFIVFQQPPHIKGKVDLNRFPKTWRVARLIPQNVKGGIESAMRQQDEVREAYGLGGPEQDVVEQLFVGIHQLTEPFLIEEATTHLLNDITHQAIQLFESIGYSDPSGRTQQRIIEHTMRAGKQDRLGRVNKLVSRVLLRAAYLDAVRREVVVRLSREKTNRVFTLLGVERSATRLNLQNTIDVLDRLVGNYGHPVFTDSTLLNPENITRAQIDDIRQILKSTVDNNLRTVRVLPYKTEAAISEVWLLSRHARRRSDYHRLKDTLAVFGLTKDFLKQYSVEELVMSKKPELALEQIRTTKTLLKEVLEDPDNRVIKVFD